MLKKKAPKKIKIKRIVISILDNDYILKEEKYLTRLQHRDSYLKSNS